MLSKIKNLNLDDAENIEPGVLVQNEKAYSYFIVKFKQHYEVYLYDDDNDTLVKGTDKKLEVAQMKATNELNKIC